MSLPVLKIAERPRPGFHLRAPATTSACVRSHLTTHEVSRGGEASQPCIVVAMTNHGPTCSIDGYPGITAASGHLADFLVSSQDGHEAACH